MATSIPPSTGATLAQILVGVLIADVLVLASLGGLFGKTMKQYDRHIEHLQENGELQAVRRSFLFRNAAIAYLALAVLLMILAFNALAALITGIIHDKTLGPTAASMVQIGVFGACFVAFLPLPVATYQIGETIRKDVLRNEDTRARFVIRFLGGSLPWLILALVLFVQTQL